MTSGSSKPPTPHSLTAGDKRRRDHRPNGRYGSHGADVTALQICSVFRRAIPSASTANPVERPRWIPRLRRRARQWIELRRRVEAPRWQNRCVNSEPVLVIDGRQIDPARIADICERFGLTELALFGSVVRGEQTDVSDVDLLYVAGPDTRLGFAINRLEDELAAVFGRPVDLVSRKALHRLIRERVEHEARTLYAA